MTNINAKLNVEKTSNESITNTHKVACVTGGAKRIGKAIVLALHSSGFRVIIHYHTSHEEAQALATLCNSLRPDSAQTVKGDLENFDDLENLAKQIMACFGRLDCLIHNASRFYPTPFQHINKNDWQSLFLTNAQAPLFLSQYLYENLQNYQGSIISILDIHANGKPFDGYIIYNMAKAAHQMMVQSLALELAPQVRVNGIAPGVNILPIDGSEQAVENEKIIKICDSIPLKRIGIPEDIAQAVLFLITAPYITGQIIAIDGGRSLTLGG